MINLCFLYKHIKYKKTKYFLLLHYLPSAVFTIPLFLLFSFVAFQTLSISAGAIEAAKLPVNVPSLFFKLSSRPVEVADELLELLIAGGPREACEFSNLTRRSSAQF